MVAYVKGYLFLFIFFRVEYEVLYADVIYGNVNNVVYSNRQG